MFQSEVVPGRTREVDRSPCVPAGFLVGLQGRSVATSVTATLPWELRLKCGRAAATLGDWLELTVRAADMKDRR